MPTIAQPLFYVYILARSNGTPFYVGKGQDDRIYDHEKEARRGHRCHKCHTIRKIWRSGGEIQRYTVFTTYDEQEALDYEKELIALYGLNTLCNCTMGGEGMSGYSPSKATRAKLSRASKAYATQPEVRARVGIQLHAPEIERKRLEGMRAYLASPEGKAQRSAQLREVNNRPEILAKKREQRGERHPNARLTEVDIVNICTWFASGEVTKLEIAQHYGLNQTTVGDIIAGKSWSHVDRPIAAIHCMTMPTEQEAQEIRRLYIEGVSQRELARRFGVTRRAIGIIIQGIK